MATIPSEMTAVAGTILTAAQWNSNVRDAINFIIAPPLYIGRQVTGQSITNSSFVAVLQDTEDIDRDGMHSTVTNTDRVTAQTAGYYACEGTIVWPTTGILSTVWLGIVLDTNGSSANRFAKQSTAASTSFNVANTTAGKVFLNVGDYVRMLAANGTGGTGTLATASDGNPRFQVQWVST